MRKKILALITALAVALGLVVTIESPAQAAADSCPAGTLCLWTGVNYTGSMAVLSWNSYYGKCTSFGATKFMSAYMRYDESNPTATAYVNLYEYAYCSSPLTQLYRGIRFFPGWGTPPIYIRSVYVGN